jgi:hypothetical protein
VVIRKQKETQRESSMIAVLPFGHGSRSDLPTCDDLCGSSVGA